MIPPHAVPFEQIAGVAVLALLMALGIVALLRGWFRPPPDAAEVERRRRSLIHTAGKLGDGEIIDVDGVSVVYSYHVAGVQYTAAQDLSGLESLLPEDRMLLIGPVAVKFEPRNPANSIVVCEQWSGLRNRGIRGADAAFGNRHP